MFSVKKYIPFINVILIMTIRFFIKYEGQAPVLKTAYIFEFFKAQSSLTDK